MIEAQKQPIFSRSWLKWGLGMIFGISSKNGLVWGFRMDFKRLLAIRFLILKRFQAIFSGFDEKWGLGYDFGDFVEKWACLGL